MWQAHMLDLGNFQAENFNLRLIRVNIIFPKKKNAQSQIKISSMNFFWIAKI